MKKIIALLLAVMLMSAMTVQTFAEQIFVKNYDGQNILERSMTLEVDLSDTIAAIKAKILEKTGIAVKQQKLFFDGTELTDDTKTLEYYGVQKENTLKLDIDLFNSPINGGSDGTYYIGISGTYTPGANADDIVSVDVEWDPMNFTYSEGTLGTWSPENHSYSGGTEGGWSTDKAGITVTNHSNVGVDATFKFEAANGVTTTGSFYASANATTALTSADQKLSLATAVGTAKDNAPAGTLYFGVSGDAISENKTLGNITISIKKSLKRTVKTEAELNAAIAALKTTGGTIELTSDLTLTDPIEIPAGTGTSTSPLIIDFGGKTVNGRIAIVGTSTSRSYVTLKNGYVRYRVSSTDTTLRDDPAQAAVYAKYTDLKLENLDIDSTELALRTSTGTKTLIESEGNSFLGEYYSNNYSNIAIYNTSSEGFTLSATNGGTFEINYYIVSNYAITLKVGGNYYFISAWGLVPFDELDSDTDIYSGITYPGSTGNGLKNICIILPTNYVTTE